MVSNAEKGGSLGFFSELIAYAFIAIGSFVTGIALHVFLIPNKLIDGGTVGLAILLTQFFSCPSALPIAVLLLSFPFVILAHSHIGKQFVTRMLFAATTFSISLYYLEGLERHFSGDLSEVIVFGGIVLGIGIGLIIKNGACLDGSEIVAIIVNRKKGYTVGQVILLFNVFIFMIAGFVYNDWNSALRSLMVYFVAYKVIDMVLQGFDEVKSVTIISKQSKAVANAILHEIGVGLTVMYGRGGFSGDNKEILYVIVERLQLVELKTVVLREDPDAFIAIEDLHEIVAGKGTSLSIGRRGKKKRRANNQ